MAEFEEKLESLLFWLPGLLISTLCLFLLQFNQNVVVYNSSVEALKIIFMMGVVAFMQVSFMVTIIIGAIRYTISKKSR